MKKFLTIAGIIVLGILLMTPSVRATDQSVTVNVDFVAPISFASVTNLQFGLLDINIGNTETIIVNTDGTLGAGSGEGSRVTSTDFPVSAATMEVTSTSGYDMTLSVGTIVNGTNSNYTLGSWTADYGDDGDETGDLTSGITITSSGASVLLEIGATLTMSKTPATAGNDDGSFVVTITYN